MSSCIQLRCDTLYPQDTRMARRLLMAVKTKLQALTSRFVLKPDIDGIDVAFSAYGCASFSLPSFKSLLDRFVEEDLLITGARVDCYVNGEDSTFYIGNEEQKAEAMNDYAHGAIIGLTEFIEPIEKENVLEDFKTALSKIPDYRSPDEVEEVRYNAG